MTSIHRDQLPKTDDEWRSRLTPEQYQVTRKAGTERAFSGEYWDCHDDGVYECVCCGIAAVLLGDEVRVGDRMAELLPGAPARRRRGGDRHEPRHGPHRGPLPELRRAPRARVPRRAPAHRAALLHEQRLVAPQPRGRLGRRPPRCDPGQERRAQRVRPGHMPSVTATVPALGAVAGAVDTRRVTALTVGVTTARFPDCKRGIAVNLAASLARDERRRARVCLVDADPVSLDVTTRLAVRGPYVDDFAGEAGPGAAALGSVHEPRCGCSRTPAPASGSRTARPRGLCRRCATSSTS